MEQRRAILVLDDETTIIDLMLKCLCPGEWGLGRADELAPGIFEPAAGELAGTRFVIARSGEEAVELVRGELVRGTVFSGAFVDLHLPGELQGSTVMRLLRDMVPGLLCTVVTGAVGQLEDVLEVFAPDAMDEWDFVAKPFERQAIAQRCRQMLASAERRRREAAQSAEIRRLNRELELWALSLRVRVQQRTAQLAEAIDGLQQKNRQLDEALAALQLTQSELVDHERMASIGQLAGGVARELARPLEASQAALHGLARSVEALVAFADVIEDEARPRPEADAADISVRARFRELCLRQRPTAAEASSLSQFAQASDGLARAASVVRELAVLAAEPDSESLEVDVAQSLLAAVDLVRPGLRAGERLEVEVGDLPPIKGHATDIQLAWMRLLRRAIAATAGRAGDAIIRVEARAEGGEVVVEVSDNGECVPESHLDRVFEPFFATRGDRTGLALPVVLGVIRRHGGDVQLAARRGGGSVLRVSLPACRPCVVAAS